MVVQPVEQVVVLVQKWAAVAAVAEVVVAEVAEVEVVVAAVEVEVEEVVEEVQHRQLLDDFEHEQQLHVLIVQLLHVHFGVEHLHQRLEYHLIVN